MTNSKIFDEVGCPDKLKDCEFELKRTKKFIKKQSDIILALEKQLEEKENEILIIKDKQKGKK